MKISDSATVSEQEWNVLMNDSDDIWLWHLWEWVETTARVWSLENHYFIAEENGRRVGGFPLQLAPASSYGQPCNRAFSIMMGSAGPFCTREMPLESRQRVLSELTKSSIDWARKRKLRVLSLSLSLPPLAHSNIQNIRGVNPLATAGWRDVSTHTLIANLSKPESDLWKDLTHDARRSVRLARSAGYTVERTNWQDMIDEYYRVHMETYRRTGTKPHPRVYFEAIANMAMRGHAVLWMARDSNNRPVAFHNCARFRNGSQYWSGCCETGHLRSGVNYLLFWNALVGAKEDDCDWYEIGEVFPDAMEGKLRGLTTFKSKFGGELYRFYRGEITLFDRCPPPYIRAASHMLPRSVRRHLGKLLYRLSV
jgi:hypothetical protein